MKGKLYKKIIIRVILILSILGIGGLIMMRDINEEKYVSLEDINEIQVYLNREKAHFIESEEGSEVKVKLHGKAMQGINIVHEIHNKTLVIKTQDQTSIPLYKDITLDIYIPKKSEKNLSINTSMSPVKIDALSLESIIYNGSIGKLDIDRLNAKKFFMKTTSGKVNIKKLNAEELQIKGKTSSINIEECIVKDGKIENPRGSITLKNTSGNLDIKGKSGKVMVAYDDFENQNVSIETTVGSIVLELPSRAEFLLEAKTSTGSFECDFPIKITDKKNINGQIGSKNNKVLLQTSSGSMKILKR